MKSLACLLLFAAAAPGATFYTLRNAHLFGGTPGPTRELVQSGAYDPSGALNNPSLVIDNGNSFLATSAYGTGPLLLTASNTVTATNAAALSFNNSPFNPTNIVSIVQSRIEETGLVATGGAGTGYFLPTFRVFGTFNDTHGSAFASATICAGTGSCPLTGLGTSAGGNQAVNFFYTPSIGASTQFTFDTPFNFFFFLNSGINSNVMGTLNPGSIQSVLYLEIVGYNIVDANGSAINGAQLTSEVFNPPPTNPNPVPEPGSLALAALGLTAIFFSRRKRSGC